MHSDNSASLPVYNGEHPPLGSFYIMWIIWWLTSSRHHAGQFTLLVTFRSPSHPIPSLQRTFLPAPTIPLLGAAAPSVRGCGWTQGPTPHTQLLQGNKEKAQVQKMISWRPSIGGLPSGEESLKKKKRCNQCESTVFFSHLAIFHISLFIIYFW